MEPKQPSSENQGNIDSSTTSNYFGKSKQQISFDFYKWIFSIIVIIVSVVLAWGRLETSSHSEETYVRKDLYIEAQKTNDKAHDEMRDLLREIRSTQIKKLDK